MKKLKERMLSILLVVVMMVTMLPVTAMAADDAVASVTFNGETTEFNDIVAAWDQATTVTTAIQTTPDNKVTITVVGIGPPCTNLVSPEIVVDELAGAHIESFNGGIATVRADAVVTKTVLRHEHHDTMEKSVVVMVGNVACEPASLEDVTEVRLDDDPLLDEQIDELLLEIEVRNESEVSTEDTTDLTILEVDRSEDLLKLRDLG